MNASANRNISTTKDIHRIATAFQQSRLLLTAVELGVFTALGNGRLTSGVIAGKIGADKRATNRLLNALCAAGLVAKKKGVLKKRPDSRRKVL